MNEIQVTDFRMAGFMVSRGASFIRTDIEEDGRTVVFIFNGESAEKLLHTYPGSVEERYDAACRSMQALVRMTQKRKK